MQVPYQMAKPSSNYPFDPNPLHEAFRNIDSNYNKFAELGPNPMNGILLKGANEYTRLQRCLSPSSS